jgi:type 1 fimbria pilin
VPLQPGRGEHVVVNADASGTETSNYGPVNFRMTFVSTSDPTASGDVTGGAKQGGSYVNMQLVDNDNGMLFSMGGGEQNFPFCKLVGSAAVDSADCGA